MSTTFTPLEVGFSWADPSTNVGGSPILPGEVTGYQLGVRADGTGAAGTYAQTIAVTGATSSTLSASAVQAALNLASGDYWASIRTVGPTDSTWSAEVPFAVLGVPNPPTGLSVA